MGSKRVAIRLDPEQYRLLQEVVAVQRRSLSSLVREVAEKEWLASRREERRKAFEWIASQTLEGIGGDWEQVKQEITEARYQSILRSLGPDYEPE